jgi:hypothetical protein
MVVTKGGGCGDGDPRRPGKLKAEKRWGELRSSGAQKLRVIDVE